MALISYDSDDEPIGYCQAQWNDWGFLFDESHHCCYLWHYTCKTKIMLPEYPNMRKWRDELYRCILTPSIHKYFDNDDDYFCTVSLFFRDELYCLICRPPSYKRWEKVMLVKENDHDISWLCSAVSFCNGKKICTLFQNGKLGILQLIPQKRATLSPIRAPTDSAAAYRKRQLVSWQDQVLLVQQKRGSPSVLEVWLADFEKQKFDRIFNLDGFNIFLIGEYAIAESSSELDEKNCVYLTENNDVYGSGADCTLYAFHIGDQTLSTTKKFCVSIALNPFTTVPQVHRQKGNKINQENSTRDNKVKRRSSGNSNVRSHGKLKRKLTSEDTNICDQLTLDIQQKISGYVSHDAHSYMDFRLVCKLWRSISPPLRWKVVDHAPRSFDQDSMWLLCLNQTDGLCTFYNPFTNLTCYMSNNDLVGCEIRYSKDGWLLVSRGKSIFLIELSSKQIIHLPEREEDYFCDTMSVSASPTNSSAWLIFGIACCVDEDFVRISYCRTGDGNWTSMTMHNNGSPFVLSCSSPVYFREEFCVIGQNGSVGAFGFSGDGHSYWDIREIDLLYSPLISDARRHFLVQRDHNVLYAVIVTREHSVRVYELEFGEYNKVTLVEDIRNWLLFISEASSIVVHGMNLSLDDAVVFPSFSSANDFIYYSLEADTYKALKDDSCIDVGHQKELLNRVWITCELVPL